MTKTKKEKEKIVDELAENLKKSKSLLFTTYIGLTVSKISKLRKLLKEKGHKYEVVKKTLIKKGFEKAGIKDFKIASANGLVIGFEEIEPIKLVYDFIKENIELMYCDNEGTFHCILVTSEKHDFGILVESEGYHYARYTAYLPKTSIRS